MGFSLPRFNNVIGKSFTCVYTKSQQRMLNVLKQEALVLERERGARCTAAERYVPSAPRALGPPWLLRVAQETAASSKNCP